MLCPPFAPRARYSRARPRPTILLAVALALTVPGLIGHSVARASIRPTRETPRSALWRKLYDRLPAAWKSRNEVLVREVSDREMDRLVEEHGDAPASSPEGDDEVQGFFEWSEPRDTPTITLRASMSTEEASFVFTHEYAHYVWEELLDRRTRRAYEDVWRDRRNRHKLVSEYAEESVDEGFAEAVAHFVRRREKLHRKDPESEDFLLDLLDRWEAAHHPAEDRP